MERPKKKGPPAKAALQTARQRNNTRQAHGQTGTFSGVYKSPGSMVAPGRPSLNLSRSRKEQP